MKVCSGCGMQSCDGRCYTDEKPSRPPTYKEVVDELNRLAEIARDQREMEL